MERIKLENKIIACMVVKNESDIVKYTIEEALTWADHIVILDNNSTDGTKEIVSKLSKEEPRIIFWGVYGGAFRDSLRSIIYNDYQHLGNGRDWWCRLDADEVYIDNPRDFLKELPENVDHVYSASFQYYLTQPTIDNINAADKQFNPNNYKYYKCDWSEIRFFRTNINTFWPLHFANPLFMIEPSDKRIRLKHFQHRDVHQMQKRFNSRKPEPGRNLFSHELKHNKIWKVEDLVYDNGVYIYNDSDLPLIKKRNYFLKKIIQLIPSLMRKLALERVLLPTKEKIQ